MKISRFIFALLCFAILYFLGYAAPTLSFKVALVLLIGIIFAILTVMNLEIGLFLLIFVVPFTQQIRLGRLGGLPVDVGTDDVLIIFIILSWLAGLARRKEPLFLNTSLNWPIIGFFTVGVFSFIGASVRFGTGAVIVSFLHLLKFFEYVAIYFIVISAINNFQQIKKFLVMFFVVTGFLAILQVSLVIIYGHCSLLRMPPSPIFVLHAIRVFQSNAILGAYYSFFLAILLAIVLNLPASKNKVPLLLFATVLSYALFYTFSRSAYLGIFVSFMIMGILKENKMVIIALLLLIFSPIYMQSAILERITITIQAFTPEVVVDASAAVRLVLWKKGLLIFLDNFLFGTGFWTTRYALGGYEAHSQYVAILIETGIVGFSVFCWLIIRMFKNSLILMEKANTYFLKALGLGYIAGLSAVLTTCFFSETFEAFRMVGPLWFVTALVTSANRLLSEKTEELDTDRA